jgi:ATP-dependent DNA helicase RecG
MLERDPRTVDELHRRGMLNYRRPTADGAQDVVRDWLASHDRITSGDFATVTGLTQAGANRALDRLVPDVLVRGSTTGRNAHYISA